VSGHTLIIDAIPWDLLSVLPGDKLDIIDTDFYEITYLNSLSKLHSTAVRGLDFHAMGKKHLENVIANNC
jgi:hypothetical protein